MKKYLSIILFAVLFLTLAACTGSRPQARAGMTVTDRDGETITVPAKLEKLIVMGGGNVEIAAALGLGDKIIAVDTYSDWVPGLNDGLTLFDMLNPDAEQMVALSPDLIILTGMMKIAGQDPLESVKEAGICITYVPTSNSIADIKKDIAFIGSVTGTGPKADEIVKDMETEIAAIGEAGKRVTDKKSVYFEISPAPYLYSFGRGVFLHEMIELIGAENVFGGLEDWISVQEETAVAANPDVILTVTDYIDDPVGEIMSRSGWGEITAVKNGDVYYIDANAATLPDHNIVTALKQMARAVYPDMFD